MEKKKLIRKNVQVPHHVAKWFEDKSRDTGMSQSSLMLLALTSYIDQQKSMDMGSMLEKIAEELGKKEQK